MPIYVYRCQACDHKLDVLQKISAAPLTKCPVCEEETLKKQMTTAAFHLKGTGWYETDFKHKGNGESKSAEKAANNGTSDSSKTPSESSKAAAEKSATSAANKSGSDKVAEKLA